MRAGLGVVLAALLAAGCTATSTSSSSGSGTAAGTSFDIVIWAHGKQGQPTRYNLWCKGVGRERGGAWRPIPNPERACARIARLGMRAFAPVPRNVACTQVYGGPQVAEVRGMLNGRPVRAVFRRTDGCQIDRWNRLRFLFPVRA